MFTIEIDNRSRKVLLNFGKLPQQFRKAVRRGHIRNGRELSKILKAGIKNPPKSGVKYRSLPNRSSAVGEYPANQSGNLMKSVKWKVGGLRLLVGYGTEARYGRFLELGVRGRMGPRPGLQTTVNTNVFKMKHNFERELTKSMGR